MKESLILRVTTRLLLPLLVLFSLFILLRGHNEPGGGFIGGLVAVSASILWAVAHGSAAGRSRLPLGDPLRLAALGVLLAAMSGIPALLLGEAYLTHLWATLPLLVTELKVSTVLIFDLGVYLCVWGALAGYALALLALDEPDGADGADGADGQRP